MSRSALDIATARPSRAALTRAALACLAGAVLLSSPLAAQVDEAAERGRAWLLSRQNLDGSFGSLPGLVPRDSGAAVFGLLAGGSSGIELDRALVYLAGAPERAAELRARRVLALAGGGRPVAGLLQSLGEFANGGGYGAFGSYESNLLDTALAVQALTLEEAGRLLEIVPLLDYLRLHQNPDGGWGYVPGDASRVYFTAETALALAGLEHLAIAPEMLDGARSHLLGRQLPDGTFGSPLETALAYRALVALGTDVSTLTASPVDVLLASQDADGSWQGDVFTTGQVLVALGGEAPNLVVSQAAAEPDTVLPGEAVTVSATIRNLGPAAAAASHLEVRAGDPEGEVRGEAAVPELAPGASHQVQVVVETAGDAGELVLFAVADARDEVAEGDEGDNVRSVRVSLRSEPDLALYGSDLAVSPPRPEPASEFRLLISARNQGETSVESFSYRVSELVVGEPTLLAEGTAGPAAPGAGALAEVFLALPEGEHLLRVELDPEGAVAEAREDNNSAEVAFFVVDEDLPDLALAEPDLVASPARPAPGETVSASATVRNLGAREATARVEIWDGEPGTGALVAAEIVTVAAGGAQTVAGSFTAGIESIAVVAVADPADGVEELSEANNRARRFLVDRPDLAIGIDNLELSPLDPLEGETVQGALTVRNAGTVTATGAAVAVYQGAPEAGAPVVFTGTLPDLPPGGNRTVSFTWIAAGGLHALTAVADPDDALAELSEANNRATRELAVPRAGGPNLTVSAVDLAGLDHSPLTLTATGTVAVTVVNDGDADAGAFLVRLVEERDGDGRPSAGDRELAVESVAGGVPAGGSAAVPLALATGFPSFRPLIHVELDPTDLVPERREDDNRRTLFGACRAEPPPASFDAVEEWFLPGLEVESVPVVVQLTDDDGDGRIDSRDVPDVVFHTEIAGGRAVTARSGLDGSEVWTVRSTPADPVEGRLANLAAADLDGDGVAEVIAVRGGRRLVALHHTGRVLWVSDPVETAGGYNWAGAPAVGDLDGDGVPEIVVGRSVLSNTGRLLAQGTANVGRGYNYYGPFGVPYFIDAPLSTIADVDLDGRAELVAGDALYRLEGGTLEVVWDRTVPDNLMVDGFTAVGQLDADPEAEIVYVSTNQVMVLNHDGSILRTSRQVQPRLPFGKVTFWAGPPSLGDLDGDGTTEILIAASEELFALRSNLSTLWRVPTTEFSEMTFAVPFDLDGDGADEVLYLDHTTFRILDGATGATLYSRPNTSKTGTEGPVVADVDGDGRAEILVPSNRSFGGDASTQGLHVLGHPSWRGTRPVWNQHTHHGTNVQVDGTVPAAETPAWLAGAGFRTNLELPAPERLLPNLTVGLPRVGRAAADGVPVVVRIGNGGLATVAPGARVALYDADPATGASPVAEGETAGPLRPGAFEDVTLFWQVAGAAGQPAWAAVDPALAEAECSEEDNAVAFIMEESVLPDLAIPAGGVTATGPLAAGQRVPVAVRVENAGAAEAVGFAVRLFDGEPALGRSIGEGTVGSLAPGASVTVEIYWDTLGVLPGRHALHGVADPDDLFLETTEDNNRGLLEMDLGEPALPDLAVETFTVEPAAVASGEAVLFSARVRNRGAPLAAGFAIAFRVNGAEVGRVAVPEALANGEARTVELPWSTAGRQGLLAVVAVADPGGAVAEVSETNNRGEAELSVAGATLSVAVATDRPSYAPGDSVAVTATAENAGGEPRSVELRVAVFDAAGVAIAELGREPVALPPGASSFDFAWESAGALPGGYSAVAELLVDGSPTARGETLFSLARQVAVTGSLFADRDLYAPGSSAVLTARVTNGSESTVLTSLTTRTAVVAPDGSEAFAAVQEIPVLYPGSDRRLESVWGVGGAAPGAYTATLSVRDGSGLLLAFTSTALAIEDTSDTGAGLRGELTVAPELVGAGAPLLADFTVANEGNADLPALALRVDLLDLATGKPAASQVAPQALARGEAAEGSLAFATAAVPAGEYLATLVAVLPGTEVILDRAAATVAPAVSVGDATVAEGDTGTNLLRFPVTLSEPFPEGVTVDFATADGTAGAGSDYQAASGTLTLAAGETAAVIEVTVLGDLDPEPDEVLLLTLSNPSGVLLGDAQALGTIRDEEGCASPDLLANGAAEAGSFDDPVPGWQQAGATGWRLRFAAPTPLEGRAAFGASASAGAAELVQTVDLSPFAARIDGGAQPFLFEGFVRSAEEPAPDAAAVVVEYLDGAGAVLAAFDSGDLVSAGAWRAVTDLRTPPAGARAARVRLLAARAAGGGSLEVYFDRLALRSIGTPTLVVEDAESLEGDADATPLAFPVSLSCAQPAPVRVDFATADGTAGSGADYEPAAGTLTLAAGETAGTVEVSVLGDVLDEPDESFTLTISTPDEPVVLRGTATGTIRDDDGPALLSVADLNVAEGDDGAAEAVVTVSLSAVSGKTVTASWSTSDGAPGSTATAGADYQAASGTVTIAAGALDASIAVPVLGDRLNEPAEAFAVTLAAPQGAALGDAVAAVTILDDDPVEIRVGDARPIEGDSGETPARFPVTLSVPSVSEVSVAYATADLDALAGVDYQPTAGTLIFAPGESAAEIAVPVLGDLEREPVESFLLTLSAPAGGHPTATLADPEAVASIVDDDGILVSVADVTVREAPGAQAVVRVSLNKSTTVAVSVDYATADGTAVAGADYQAVSGTLTIPAGAVAVDVSVAIVDDLLYEPPQSFSLVLSNPSAEAILLDSEAEATVLDDDGWALNGTADDAIIPGCIVLTPPVNNRSGSAWRRERIDLARSFDQTFRIYAGDQDSRGDGLTFALQDAGTTALGGLHVGLGYSGISPSIAVEIDTRDQGADPSFDHMAVDLNGAIDHAGHPPVQASATSGDVEDGTEHLLRLLWNEPDRTLTAYFDGDPRLRFTRDMATEVFGGSSSVLYGFTAATGASGNLQYFCPTAECYGPDGSPAISIGDAEVTEGDSGTAQLHFPVTLSCPSDDPVTVSIASEEGTARSGEDYLPVSATLAFEPGETAKDLVVEVVGDTKGEPDEKLSVLLSVPSGGSLRYARGIGTILSDEAPVTVGTTPSSEGTGINGFVTFKLTLGAALAEPVAVSWATADGTARASEDYVAGSGSVTFQPGQVERLVHVRLIGDSIPEPDETFFLDLVGAGAIDPPSSRTELTFFDDDACPSENLLVNPGCELPLVAGEIPGWTEVLGTGWTRVTSPQPGDGAAFFFPGAATVPVAELRQDVDLSAWAERIDAGQQSFAFHGLVKSLEEATPDSTRVVVEFRDATKTAVLDAFDTGEVANQEVWQAVGGVRTAPPGARWIVLRLVSTYYNGNNINGFYDRLVLRALGSPLILAVDVSVAEGSSGSRPAELPLALTCPSAGPVSVDYLTADATARAGADYSSTLGTATFAPGEVATTAEVPILGDTLDEGDETFLLRLSNPVGAVLGRAEAVVTILDDESVLSIGDVTVLEGDAAGNVAHFPVTLTPAVDQTVRVDYTTADGPAGSGALAGSDYAPASGTLTFEPGQTQRTVSVQLLGDAESEPDETFLVRLSNPLNSVIGDAEGVGTIVDDDLSISIADTAVVEGSSGSVEAVFPVVLSRASSRQVTVAFVTEDVLAVAGEDYLPASGTVVFAAGQVAAEIRVEVLGDEVFEPSETFLVRLSDPVNASLLTAEGLGTIADDDDCAGPNLLRNPGAELPLAGGKHRYWEEVSGTWGIRTSVPAPHEGGAYFVPSSGASAELRQDIDVVAYAPFIDASIQRFALEVFVGSATEAQPDTARVILDYLEADGTTLLDRFDSGEITAPGVWRQVSDLRVAPVGTRILRLRLLGRRSGTSGATNSYFDALALRSLGTPVLEVGFASVPEGDAGTTSLEIPVTLTCAGESPITVRFGTEGGTALAGTDYLSAAGVLTFEPGSLVQTVPVAVLGDTALELEETILLSLSEPSGAVVSGRGGRGSIRDDDNSGRTTREIRTFWVGDLRIFAWAGETEITLIDIDTGQPLSMNDSRIQSTNFATNPFVLADPGDSFEGAAFNLRVRVIASDATGAGQLKPITVWTGRLASADHHPADPPSSGDAWASYLPAFSIEERANGRELGREFLGFTTRELTIFARPGAQPTVIRIEDLESNADLDSDDSRTLGPADAEYADGDIEVYYVEGFEDDTVRIASNTEVSVLAGFLTRELPDWTVTPPSYDLGDDGIELGKEFYTFVHRSMTVFPVEDDTTVTITDLSDGDDSLTFTLADGDTVGDYDLFTPVRSTRNGGSIVPRPNGPKVDILSTGNPFDNDYVRVTADKPVLLYVGPAGSDVNEFADVAFSVPTGPESRIIYCYAQNGGENDLQIFGFTDDTEVAITSLTVTSNFNGSTFHDFQIGPGIGGSGRWLRGRPDSDVWWGSTVWSGELLRIESNKPVIVINGDYDLPHFGAFIPFLVDTLDLPPVAEAGPDRAVTAGETVLLDGSASFDQDDLVGPATPRWEWDFDLATDSDGDGDAGNDIDAVGPAAQHIYLLPGTYAVGLTFFDDEGESDRDVAEVTVSAHPLALTKSAEGVPARPGDPLTYTLAVTNLSASPVTRVVVSDDLPEHVTLAGAIETSAGSVTSDDPVRVEIPELGPSQQATVTIPVRVAAPLALEVVELVNQARAFADGLPAYPSDDPSTVEPLDATVVPVEHPPDAGEPVLAASKADTLAFDADGDGAPSPGDEIGYQMVVTNAGAAPATGVVFRDLAPAHATIVPGSVATTTGLVVTEDPVEVDLATLEAGSAATVTFRVAVDLPVPAAVDRISNQGTVTSAELPAVLTDDPDAGGDADPTVTMLSAAPELAAEKTDRLAADHDGDGVVSPGDELEYTVTIRNAGNTAATGVFLADPIPEHTAVVGGSVAATVGTVEAEDPVRVALGELAGGASAEVRFRVRIESPIAAGVREVSNQGLVSSAELPDVVTDDPDVDGPADPTVTPVVAAPVLRVEKTDSLFDDPEGDGLASPGDVLLYRVTIANSGNTAATAVVLTDPVPEHTALEAGTVQASQGTVVSEDPVTVELGQLDAGAEATVSFRVRIAEPFPLDALSVENQAVVESAELDPVPSDDPETPEPADPTVTEVFVTPDLAVGDATVTEASGLMAFPVTLSRPTPREVRVNYATADAPADAGTPPATAGIDYLAAAGTVTIPPGATETTIPVEILDDPVDELDESFLLVLSEPEGALLVDPEGLGTIVDDDEARISIGDVTVEEGDSGTADALFPVRLSVPADREVTVRYATVPGSAAEGEDFLPAAGILAFPAGTTERAIAVPVVGDLVIEPLEESFTVELSEPTGAPIEDPVGLGTILDDEECPGPNLLANPGAEERPVLVEGEAELPGWVEVEGASWQRRFEDPDPAEGAAYFFAGEAELGELVQEVSVRAYEVRIDGGAPGEPGQRFAFSGRVRTFQESPPDTARIVVEYRDRTNAVVLDAFNSGEIASPDEWSEVADARTAPAGTGWIRVRLIATRFAGQENDGYFDDLALRSLRAPTLTVSDVTVYEGDSGETPAPFTVRLACPFYREVTVSYATADGPPETGATAGSDYLAVSGVLVFPPGETEATVPVPVLGDEVHERHESFFLDLREVTPAAEVVLLDPRGEGLILNDDFCARSHGFWKTHEELWPTDRLVLGGAEYGRTELAAFLAADSGDQTLHLALQLVATKFNLLVGSDPVVVPLVEDADAFLAVFPPGSDPRGADREAAEALKNQLDAYNNSPCQENPVIPE